MVGSAPIGHARTKAHPYYSVQVSSMWSGSVQGRHMARLGAFLFSFIKRKVLVPYRILK
ncbi:hypothetical protein RchiOBHm_Chr3g0485461 [Rosa chinensis]|uniref:Uncharacterized protein n=1 Tax=Rosa chinensis TaxID=74649 RepID=A0A2P6RF07_ROSCH|nr:hypothetical protein RchiOBHm_Chr3g0485461 [Rosa chinensis]